MPGTLESVPGTVNTDRRLPREELELPEGDEYSYRISVVPRVVTASFHLGVGVLQSRRLVQRKQRQTCLSVRIGMMPRVS